jgi:hypothetical protein
MTRESEGERPQKTVAELLAEHGASVGGPRRRRRRAAEDDGPDIGDTAPQAIIERVRGDAPPPPEHRNGRNSRYLEVPAEFRNGHGAQADEQQPPPRPPQAPPRPPASTENTRVRPPAPPGPQQTSGERRLPPRQPQPSAPQPPVPPAQGGTLSARLDGLDEVSEQPPAAPPAPPMGTGSHPVPPRGPRRPRRAAPPQQEPHTEQIPVVPSDEVPPDAGAPAPNDPPAGLARWRRRGLGGHGRHQTDLGVLHLHGLPAPPAEDDLDGGPPTGTYTPTFDTGPQPAVPEEQADNYDAGYGDDPYGGDSYGSEYEDFRYDGYERNGYPGGGYSDTGYQDGDFGGEPDGGERGRRGELGGADTDFDPDDADRDLDHPERGDLDELDREDLDGDELDEHELDEQEPSPAKQWLVLAGQLALGVAGGAGVWLGFSWLWGQLPAAALIAALLVVVALVWIVRKIRRAEDLQTTVLAVLVGLVVTVSPAALLLVSR